jgi:hypothetical protein
MFVYLCVPIYLFIHLICLCICLSTMHVHQGPKGRRSTAFKMEVRSTSTVRRLTVNLRNAKAFISYYYPKLARAAATNDSSFLTGSQTGTVKTGTVQESRQCACSESRSAAICHEMGMFLQVRQAHTGTVHTTTRVARKATSPGESCRTQ